MKDRGKDRVNYATVDAPTGSDRPGLQAIINGVSATALDELGEALLDFLMKQL